MAEASEQKLSHIGLTIESKFNARMQQIANSNSSETVGAEKDYFGAREMADAETRFKSISDAAFADAEKDVKQALQTDVLKLSEQTQASYAQLAEQDKIRKAAVRQKAVSLMGDVFKTAGSNLVARVSNGGSWVGHQVSVVGTNLSGLAQQASAVVKGVRSTRPAMQAARNNVNEQYKAG